MSFAELFALFPLIILTTAIVFMMLVIAFFRNHAVTVVLSVTALIAGIASLPLIAPRVPQQVSPLIMMDGYAIFFIGVILASTLAVALLSYPYLNKRSERREEYYLLLLLASLGCSVIVACSHFASFFLGLQILNVALYGLIAYPDRSAVSLEAGVKYLILAAASDAFLLFGMALIYAATGSPEFAAFASGLNRASGPLFVTGVGLLITGIGFKLSVVPFHLWTPDVYQGAPAPITAFLATVSKAAVFALLLRYFTLSGVQANRSIFLVFCVLAVASMLAGNLLALMQNNVKRILAYSSIAHFGYLLVAFLASGSLAATAVAFYLAAYCVTNLGAFGVIAFLSDGERDADLLDDYRGLGWERPWAAGVFTAMLLSLAGIPLTAGFVGKFYVVAAGLGSALWLMVAILLATSVIGLFYYLRIVVAMYGPIRKGRGRIVIGSGDSSFITGFVLAVLTLLLVGLGAYPGPLINIIQSTGATINGSF